MSNPYENFGILLGETARSWRHRLDQRLKPLGLSQARWIVVLYLSRYGDGVSQKELAGRIGIEGPTLVGLLDRMAADGWLERRPSTRDRRCKTVHLTEKAREVSTSIRRIARELREELLADIPAEEIATCMGVLERIKGRVEAQR